MVLPESKIFGLLARLCIQDDMSKEIVQYVVTILLYKECFMRGNLLHCVPIQIEFNYQREASGK